MQQAFTPSSLPRSALQEGSMIPGPPPPKGAQHGVPGERSSLCHITLGVQAPRRFTIRDTRLPAAQIPCVSRLLASISGGGSITRINGFHLNSPLTGRVAPGNMVPKPLAAVSGNSKDRHIRRSGTRQTASALREVQGKRPINCLTAGGVGAEHPEERDKEARCLCQKETRPQRSLVPSLGRQRR